MMPPGQASSGSASVNVSSWPSVSLPYSTGIAAPTATTTTIVPKKIDREAVYGANRNGASTPANIRANDSPQEVSSSAQRRRELLGEVDPDGREARQHGKAGNQRSGAEHDGCRRSSPMGQHHQEGAGIDSTNAPVIVHRRPMISMMYPLKSLPGMLAAKTSELSPTLKVTAAP